MTKSNRLTTGIFISLIFIAFIWCIKSAEILYHLDLSIFGLIPQSFLGLLGIVTAPLIHGSLEHIFNNTLAILILGSVLYYGYPKSWLKVLTFVWLFSGVGVWFFAREANHIGASGLTHGVFFFLLLASIFRRDKRSVALMMIAFLMYGSMTMSIFPREESISFEYHLFGALAGLIAAIVWKDFDPKPIEKKYEWEGEELVEDEQDQDFNYQGEGDYDTEYFDEYDDENENRPTHPLDKKHISHRTLH